MGKTRPRAGSTTRGSPPSGQLGERVALLEAVLAQTQDAVESLREQMRRIDELGVELGTIAGRADATQAQLAAQVNRIDTLSVAVAHGIEHVERTEARIRATVRRAREELEGSGLSSPGLEAEVGQLQLYDARSGESRPVPPVRATVDTDTVADVADPLLENLRRLRLSR